MLLNQFSHSAWCRWNSSGWICGIQVWTFSWNDNANGNEIYILPTGNLIWSVWLRIRKVQVCECDYVVQIALRFDTLNVRLYYFEHRFLVWLSQRTQPPHRGRSPVVISSAAGWSYDQYNVMCFRNPWRINLHFRYETDECKVTTLKIWSTSHLLTHPTPD